MLHLPEIPYWVIEKNLFEIGFVCWSGISLLQIPKR